MTATVLGANVKQHKRNVTGTRFGDNAMSDKNANNPPRARQCPRIQDFMDEIADIPVLPYGHFKPAFEGHYLATDEGIEELRQAKVVTVSTSSEDRPVVLFGLEEAEQANAEGAEHDAVFNIRVFSADELVFVLSAVLEVKGKIDHPRNVRAPI